MASQENQHIRKNQDLCRHLEGTLEGGEDALVIPESRMQLADQQQEVREGAASASIAAMLEVHEGKDL